MSEATFVDTDTDVYLGTWINWSKGRVLGGTLTTTQFAGNVLIAFAALFVTYVGTRSWAICAFYVHCRRTSKEHRDGLHHQVQLILRNSDTASQAFWELISVYWAWKKIASAPLLRTFPWLALMLFTITWTAVAGLFSSQLASTTGNEVLLSAKNCSTMFSIEDNDPAFLQRIQSQEIFRYFNYAQNCYRGIRSSNTCNLFVQPRVAIEVNRNTTCPFGQEVCLNQQGNLHLQTQAINSHHHFGINAPPNERYDYQLSMKCAPLALEGFKERRNLTTKNVNFPAIVYNYGSVEYPNYNGSFSYFYTNISTPVDLTDIFTSFPDFGVNAISAYVMNGSYAEKVFRPIPPLQVMDADLDIVFISSNKIRFGGRVEDPIFAAHTPNGWFQSTGPGSSPDEPVFSVRKTAYTGDEPATALACMSQHRICFPEGIPERGCTPWGGWADLNYSLGKRVHDQRRRSMWEWRTATSFGQIYDIQSIIATLLSGALLARESVTYSISSQLPDNQWQLEVENWMAVALSSLQGAPVRSSIGYKNSKLNTTAPETAEQRYLCRNQKIISAAHVNFSVFGLSFTFAIGVCLIILSFVIEPATRVYCEKRKRDQYSLIEWDANQTLQVHRMLQEELGYGRWKHCAEGVPVTEKGEQLAVLNLENPSHPKLSRFNTVGHASSIICEKVESETDGSKTQVAVTRMEEDEDRIRPVGPPVDTPPKFVLPEAKEA